MAFRNNRRPAAPAGTRRIATDGQSFLTVLRRFTDAAVVERGDRYAGASRVVVTRGSRRAAVATVTGTGVYTTTIRIADDGVHLTCTCPFYIDRQRVCKHLWATAVVASAQGKLSGVAIRPRVIFREIDEEFERGFTEDRQEEERERQAREELPPSPPFPARRRRAQPEEEPPAHEAASWLSGDIIIVDGPNVLSLGPPPGTRSWRSGLEEVRGREEPTETRAHSVTSRQIHYVIDLEMSRAEGALRLLLYGRNQLRNGEWGQLLETQIGPEDVDRLADPLDRRILAALLGSIVSEVPHSAGWNAMHNLRSRFRMLEAAATTLLPLMGESGRCSVRRAWSDHRFTRVAVDIERRLTARLIVTPSENPRGHMMRLVLVDESGIAPEPPPRLVVPGFALLGDTFVAAEMPPESWREMLGATPLWVAPGEEEALIESLLAMPVRPRLELPESLRYEEVIVAPLPMLSLAAEGDKHPTVIGTLRALYEDRTVEITDPRPGLYDATTRRLLVRDAEAETRMGARLQEVGFKRVTYRDDGALYQIGVRRLGQAVRELVAEGWHVEAEGKVYRQMVASTVSVGTGIDWFEVHGQVSFGGQTVSLPQLLTALRRGQETIVLGDGTFGIVPEEWLRRYAPIVGLGEEHGDHIRLKRSQVGLLDALVAAIPEVTIDERAAAAREQLASFAGVVAADPPPSFTGTLREYQREGLGWALALERLGFGGCLADDMGLGKTVVALALLETRRARREEIATASTNDVTRDVAPSDASSSEAAPTIDPGDTPRRTSLIVVPKSLMFNWRQEAERFAPQLRVIDHIGMTRLKAATELADYDIVLTTYGTLRQDVMLLKDVAFDYVILDEAQAIKNATSVSARAVRLLDARHRLALSGTPVENHLGELWSLFEFLNPGMLGAAAAFARFTAAGTDTAARDGLRRALRPFILRRTKAQVASDLPEKLEQTLECELGPTQRRQYDELRRFYRASVLGTIAKQGIAKSKIQILEALLRLRQAACHPALLDPKRRGATSAKFDVLIPMLEDVIDSGSKALVFSQFTTLLGLLREELDRRGIAYEYLDGRTRDRQERVERFQNDPALPLFLISLKAGGVGLNLTAAEYVFLLDPWWNPAVEAQAIDRTHRIGQQRRVFAYRVIASETIEDRVIELQSRKRDLADAIITEDNSLVRGLQKEDFELLLS